MISYLNFKRPMFIYNIFFKTTMLICNIFPFFVLNTEGQTKDDENVKTDYDATITLIVCTLETS